MVANGPNMSTLCSNCSVSFYPEVDISKTVIMGIVMVVFFIFGILGNMLVILSVLFHHHWRSVTHYFIVNLAAADLLLSSAVMPFSAASEALGRWVFGRTFCSVWAALDVLCCTASILSLCVISIDRYLAVSYPLRYPTVATGRRCLAAVACLWGLSAAISVGPLFGWKQPQPEDETVCQITEEPGYALFSALGSFYIPLAIILVMYCRVYTVATRETKSLRKGSKGENTEGVTLRIHRGNAGHSDKQDSVKHKRASFAVLKRIKFSSEEKAAKTLGIVVGCFVLCWLPFFLVLPIGSIFPSCKPSETVFKITFWLGYFNSCINPIIYPCFSKEFNRAFQHVLRGRCLRTGPQTSVPVTSTAAAPITQVVPLPAASQVLESSGPSPSICFCSCCGSGGGGKGHTQSRSKVLLKTWCFSRRQGRRENSGSAKVLRLSIGAAGEEV
uniref:Alpha-1A adrenergic receptor n=1 Tax=Periophthalmus magnuspinnatus TaxID=409849 RepID=A0A3B4AKX6_9GOBI